MQSVAKQLIRSGTSGSLRIAKTAPKAPSCPGPDQHARYPDGGYDVKFAQVRKYALSLPDVTEKPHFDRTSFRVGGKIFVTARPAESHIHVFVPEVHREPALALYAGQVSKLFWGGKVVGLRIELPKATVGVVNDLIRNAWKAKAPKSLIREK